MLPRRRFPATKSSPLFNAAGVSAAKKIRLIEEASQPGMSGDERSCEVSPYGVKRAHLPARDHGVQFARMALDLRPFRRSVETGREQPIASQEMARQLFRELFVQIEPSGRRKAD
ncbi:MAG: hypothetical protein WC689_03550 [Methylocystis sp.]|jgi:hypothetical protein